MPPTKRKISLGPGVPLKDAELIEVRQSNELWNDYLLSDGTALKMKTIVSEVWRIVGEYDNEGNPIYFVRSTNILNINAPDELRKPV
jgi:hypothetical protein